MCLWGVCRMLELGARRWMLERVLGRRAGASSWRLATPSLGLGGRRRQRLPRSQTATAITTAW